MHESYKKWLDDGKPKVFCQHCNKEIIINESYKYRGIPKYIRGHNRNGIPHTNEVKEILSRKNRNYHHTEEAKNKIRENNKGKHNHNGKNNPMYGKHHTEESKQKNSESHKGKIGWNKGLTKETDSRVKKISDLMKNTNFSDEHRNKIRLSRLGKIGKDANNWKGGITLLHFQIRENPNYQDWKIKIFKRDNFTCQNCKYFGHLIEAHHIKLFSDICKENNILNIEDAIKCNELWRLDNGITYCIKCHKLLKNKGGKLNCNAITN